MPNINLSSEESILVYEALLRKKDLLEHRLSVITNDKKGTQSKKAKHDNRSVKEGSKITKIENIETNIQTAIDDIQSIIDQL